MNTPKIKLFICIPTLQCGGSEKYVHTVCKYIDKERFEVTLLVLDNKDPFYNIDPAVELIDLHTARARNTVSKIIRLVKERKPDILFSAASHLNILLAMFRKRFPAGMVLLARESSLLSANNRNAAVPLLFDRLAKIFYKQVDHIICQSAAMQQDLAGQFNIPENKTTVLVNPVEIENDVAVDFTPFKFITVARLSKEKGIDRLIKAIAGLAVPCVFHVIGEGKERAALEALAGNLGVEKQIIFHGRLEHPFKGMEDARFFLMGSYHEGLPNALLEAGALGIPAIAYDVPGGIGEIIREGENGLLVKENSPAAFTMTIQKGLSMHFNRRDIQTQTAKRFSPGNHLSGLEGLLTHLLHQNN